MHSSLFLFASAISSAAAAALPATESYYPAELPLGAECNPDSSKCANGADCYAVAAGQILRCGNFQSSCTSDEQCAFNTCNLGFCNGLLPSTTTSCASTPEPTTMVYLPLGAECNPDSTPCTNGAKCYSTNSMLKLRCGNFQATCTSDEQCAYNTCKDGFCSGLIPSTTTSSAPTSEPTMVYLPLGAPCNPNSTPCINGSVCYSSAPGEEAICGSNKAACSSDAQCFSNSCQDGACSGTPAMTTPSTPIHTGY